jgi:antitoxin (DNA-binding transcriptional repressor) of toxin-antitoxin stability system
VYTIGDPVVYTWKGVRMGFVTVRELRSRSAEVWRRLGEEPDLVITSNGKPVAILSAVSSAGLEELLAALRRAWAMAAVEAMQTRSVAAGRHRTKPSAIQAEIAAVCKGRGK